MTYERAFQQATIEANRCGRGYIYRLTDGRYYVSDNPPAMINAAYVATLTRTPTGALVVDGGLTPRLIYTETGLTVQVGDEVTISGEVSVVGYFRPPHKASSAGFVSVHAPGEPNASAEYYVGVIGAKWVDRDDRAPTPDVVAMIDEPPPVPSDTTTSDATTSHDNPVTYQQISAGAGATHGDTVRGGV